MALAQAAHSPEEGAPLVLTQFALDGAPDLGSVLYLEVRGQDHLGYLGSVLMDAPLLPTCAKRRRGPRRRESVGDYLPPWLPGRPS